MNARDVGSLVSTIQRLWPTSTFTATVDAALVRTWAVVLADVPLEAAEAMVAARARAGDTFPPPPGTIAHDVLHTIARMNGDAAPDPDQAWDEVQSAIARRGWYEGAPLSWSHPAVGAAAQAIGWNELCHGDTMITRAHFLKLYPTIAARTDSDRRLHETLTALDAGSLVKELGDGQ